MEVNVPERHVCLAFAFEDGATHGFIIPDLPNPGKRHESVTAIVDELLSSGHPVLLSHAC